MPLRNFKNHLGVICAWVNIDDSTHYYILVLVRKYWESNVLKTPVKYNDLHICSFFSVTLNGLQMINLKKLLGCWPFQIIQNFCNSSRSCAIFIFNITCRSSLRTLNVLYSVFECADPMHNIHIFKLWSNYSKIGLLFYVFWTFT